MATSGKLPGASGIDIRELDQLCNSVLSVNQEEREHAEKLLLEFQNRDDTWLKVPGILAETTNEQTRFFALQVLEQLLKFRWASVGATERQSVREFIFSSTCRYAATTELLISNKVFVRKLDSVLIEVLKAEWPRNWPTFIDELLHAANSHPALCENAFVILRMFSEEMHDYWSAFITHRKVHTMRAQLGDEFAKIFPMIFSVLQTASQISDPSPQNLSLVRAALLTLHQYLSWVSESFLLDPNLVDAILVCLRFRELQIPAMQCLYNISTITCADEDDQAQVGIFYSIVTAIQKMIPIDSTNSYESWRQGVSQEWANCLALVLTGLLGEHLILFEDWRVHETFLNAAHFYLYKLSALEDDDVLRICFTYWWKLFAFVYDDRTRFPDPVEEPGLIETSDLALLARLNYYGRPPAPGEGSVELLEVVDKRLRMRTIFDYVERVLVDRMVPPSETQTIENDEGELVREEIDETQQRYLWFEMRETVIYLSHVDFYGTVELVQRTLENMLQDPSRFSADSVNRLCWMIIAISSRLHDVDCGDVFTPMAAGALLEMRLGICPHPHSWFETQLGILVKLERAQTSKENQLAVSINITQMLARYPSILTRPDNKYISTCFERLIYFVTDPDVSASQREVAVDSLRMASYFARPRVCSSSSPSGEGTFIERFVVDKIGVIYQSLEQRPGLLASVLSSLASAVRGLREYPVALQRCLTLLLQPPNETISRILGEMQLNPDALTKPEVSRALLSSLKLNVGVAEYLRSLFSYQMEILASQVHLPTLYLHVTNLVYRAVTELGGAVAADHSSVRTLCGIRCHILVLLKEYAVGLAVDQNVEKYPIDDDVTRFTQVLVPEMLAVAFQDLRRTPPALMESEVFWLVERMFMNFGEPLSTELISTMVDACLEAMEKLIATGTFESLPHIRRAAYCAIGMGVSIRVFSTEVMLPEMQKRLVDIVLAGMSVYNRDVAKNALVTTYHLFSPYFPLRLGFGGRSPLVADPDLSFVRDHAERVLDGLWTILSDTEHQNTFVDQAPVLARIWDIFSKAHKQVLAPEKYAPGETNHDWLKRWFTTSLAKAFPQTIAEPETGDALFEILWERPRDTTEEEDAFGIVLRDYLLELAQFRQKPTAELFTRRRESSRSQLDNERAFPGERNAVNSKNGHRVNSVS